MKTLLIDTATDNCSVGIADDSQLLTVVEQVGKRQHSEVLNTFIQKAISRLSLNFEDLGGIAVGKGPGSYTGLRIGVSTAKALCYALNLPLVGIGSLEALANQAINHTQGDKGAYMPMLDARRMEVYTALYGPSLGPLKATTGLVIDQQSLDHILAHQTKVYLVGEGAHKATGYIEGYDGVEILPIHYPSASGMAELAAQAFANGRTEEVSSFEPFYLKGVAAGKNEKLNKLLKQ